METIIKFQGKMKLHAFKSERLVLNLSNMELCNQSHKITGEVVQGNSNLDGFVLLEPKFFMTNAEVFFIKIVNDVISVFGWSFRQMLT